MIVHEFEKKLLDEFQNRFWHYLSTKIANLSPFLIFVACLFDKKVLKMNKYFKNVEFRKKKILVKNLPPAGFEPGTSGSTGH